MGKQAFLSYCPKCGNQGIYENGNEICQYCGTKELPTKYDWDKWLFGSEYPNNLNEIIFNEYIKDNPLFDENIYEQRKGKEKFLQQASLDKQREQNKPKCPICQSTNGLLSRELDACDSSTLHFYPEVFQTDSSGNQPQPQVFPTNHPPVCKRHKEQNLQ